MSKSCIGLGSNMGDRENNIRKALKLLNEKGRVLKVSSLYETEPLYNKKQDWFVNCTAIIETELQPKELLEFLLKVEKSLGRVRNMKHGPRTIDLDILFYENMSISEEDISIPHPGISERLFVLKPLSEICPDLQHPLLKKTVKELLKELKDNQKIRKL